MAIPFITEKDGWRSFSDWWWKMASEVIDISELNKLAKGLYEVGVKFPRKQKKFMEKQGAHLKAATVSEGKKHGKNIAKMSKRGTKLGKYYRHKKSAAIRVYSAEPHAHLIEDGHRMVTHDGQEVGFVPGAHVFENASKKFEPHFLKEVEGMIDEAFEKL